MKAVMQRGVILYLIMSACCIAASTDPFPPEALPAVSIGEFLPPDFEASGLVWHTRRQKLFLVSDNGFLASMTDQGTDVELWRISADLEAVTVAFRRAILSILALSIPTVFIIQYHDRRYHARFQFNAVDGWAQNSGLEALTFVPDPADRKVACFMQACRSPARFFVFACTILSSAEVPP